MSDVTIGNGTYRIGKLSCRSQFHLTRRLAPFIQAMGTNLAAFDRIQNGDFAALQPLAEVLAKMSDADADYVINLCLSVCERQHGPTWAKVTAPNGAIMFADIEMPQMIRLAIEAIRENLKGFFPGGGQASEAAPATA